MALSIATVVVATAFPAAAPAQDAPRTYGLREPSGASAIQRYLTTGSRIPINRRYADLSEPDKKILHEQWEDMAPGDEPPFPISGLRPIHAAMAKAQGALSVEGPLVLIASVSATGEVTEVQALGSPSAEMTKYAAAVLFNTKFKPAVCAGKACAMQYPFSFLFQT